MLTFSQWLAANKYEEASLTADQRKHLESAWKAEIATANPPPPIPAPTPKPPETVSDRLAAYESESARKAFVQDSCEQWAKDNPYASPEKLKQLRELQQLALDDQKMSQADFRYQMLRFDRTIGMMVTTPREEQTTDDVVEAALCVTNRLKNVEKRFSERTLEAAHKRFRGGLTLVGMVSIAARQNGYRGDIGGAGNLLPMWQAALRGRHNSEMMAGQGSGLSTISVPGILGSTANKALTTQFNFGDQSWREIAKIRSANDFKLMTTYRLTGSNKFIKIPPGGEIKHGTLGELSYTNQIDTYGIMLGIDRRDLINDDLSAFMGRGEEIGNGSIDGFNDVFWTEWLDDSAFFPTDKSLANYDDGATDSVLSLAGLENADGIFAAQTKPNGSILGARPAILLVPTSLQNTAAGLMASSPIMGVPTTPLTTGFNVWASRFKVVSSPYLQSAAITGYSATAWYLLADPNNLAAIEVAFLFGRDTPIVEEAELDFNRLGMQWRAYWDFGVAKQEYRAGVKLKGAA